MPAKLTQDKVEQWLKLVSGSFNVHDIWNELDIMVPENRQHLRVILLRLEGSQVITRLSKDGTYRKVDTTLTAMDWQAADPNKIVALTFPFGIEEHCRIYPKSVIIVAGSKNAGKTTLLYDFIHRNMNNFDIDLFNSETGMEQMKERFDPLDIPEPAPFNVYERYDNYADVIHPDRISVIDYLDLNSEVYLVGTEIDAIFRKLNQGVAIIGLQKPPPSVTYLKGVKKVIERDLAYGGGFTAKRAVLYITMSDNKLKLLYVKSPRNPKINPNNMQWTFTIEEGIFFRNVKQTWETEDPWPGD